MGNFLSAFEDGYSGFVTYYASDEVSWGSDHNHWMVLASAAFERDMLFVPTVSPGFNDSVIDRWNMRQVKSRDCSRFYDSRWDRAVDVKPEVIMINSFNDWPMGTTIEPVVDRENYTLNDRIWCGRDGNFFVKRTKDWVAKFKADA
jgi:glycoprotein endo-alpha-1,2-mannosidase